MLHNFLFLRLLGSAGSICCGECKGPIIFGDYDLHLAQAGCVEILHRLQDGRIGQIFPKVVKVVDESRDQMAQGQKPSVLAGAIMELLGNGEGQVDLVIFSVPSIPAYKLTARKRWHTRWVGSFNSLSLLFLLRKNGVMAISFQ